MLHGFFLTCVPYFITYKMLQCIKCPDKKNLKEIVKKYFSWYFKVLPTISSFTHWTAHFNMTNHDKFIRVRSSIQYMVTIYNVIIRREFTVHNTSKTWPGILTNRDKLITGALILNWIHVNLDTEGKLWFMCKSKHRMTLTVLLNPYSGIIAWNPCQ